MRATTALVASIASISIIGASPAPVDAQFGSIKKVVKKVVPKEIRKPEILIPTVAEKVKDEVLEPATDVVKELADGADSLADEIEKGLESSWHEIERTGRKLDDELDRFLQSTKEEVERSGGKLDDEVFQRIKKEVERFGGKLDDEVFQPAKEFLDRCYEGAEREPDPATRKARKEECDEKQTGIILGAVGVAVGGALFGPPGAVVGGVGGSVAGSAIDGARNGYVGFILSDGASSFDPAPNRTPSGERSASSLPSNWSPETREMAALILKDRELAQGLKWAFVAYGFADPFSALQNFKAFASGAGLIPRVQSCNAKAAVTHRRMQALVFSGSRKVKFNTRAESKWVEALEESLAAHCAPPPEKKNETS